MCAPVLTKLAPCSSAHGGSCIIRTVCRKCVIIDELGGFNKIRNLSWVPLVIGDPTCRHMLTTVSFDVGALIRPH